MISSSIISTPQRQGRCKNKTDIVIKTMYLSFSPLRGRGRGCGGLRKPPRFCYFWLPKVHRALRLRRSFHNCCVIKSLLCLHKKRSFFVKLLKNCMIFMKVHRCLLKILNFHNSLSAQISLPHSGQYLYLLIPIQPHLHL